MGFLTPMAFDLGYTYQQAEVFAGLLCLVIPICVIAVDVAIGVWVYRDANSRGKDGTMWLLIVVFTGIIGLIIWFIVRDEPARVPVQHYGYPPAAYYPPYQQYQYQAPPPAQQAYNPYERVVTEEVYYYDVPVDTYDPRLDQKRR
jgi:hypothetical protein